MDALKSTHCLRIISEMHLGSPRTDFKKAAQPIIIIEFTSFSTTIASKCAAPLGDHNQCKMNLL